MSNLCQMRCHSPDAYVMFDKETSYTPGQGYYGMGTDGKPGYFFSSGSSTYANICTCPDGSQSPVN